MNGVAFTFKASPSGGTEVDIGADLDESLDNLVTALNGSADADISVATYTHYTGSNLLEIAYDTTGSGGDAYTLAASAAIPSATTLLGGAQKQHAFLSGAASIPSMTFQVEFPSVGVYSIQSGQIVNTMSLEFTRSGGASATFEVIGQKEVDYSSNQAGTPGNRTVKRFNQFNGYIKKDRAQIANITRISINFSNGAERVNTIREDAYTEGVDPTKTSLSGEITVRFADKILLNAANAGTTVRLDFGFHISYAERISMTVYNALLSTPKKQITGPGGVEMTFQFNGFALPGGAMFGAILVNDVTSYN